MNMAPIQTNFAGMTGFLGVSELIRVSDDGSLRLSHWGTVCDEKSALQ
jgi:hypothetical protein